MEIIRLVQFNDGITEVLEGIGGDEFCISDAMVDATVGNMRIFPHIVKAVAANVADAKELSKPEHLEIMALIRDSFLTAIYIRNMDLNDIMNTTTSEST